MSIIMVIIIKTKIELMTDAEIMADTELSPQYRING